MKEVTRILIEIMTYTFILSDAMYPVTTGNNSMKYIQPSDLLIEHLKIIIKN